MGTIHITSSLKPLVRGYDYIIVCKDLKRVTVPVEGTRVQYQVEMTEPIEYTKEELFNKYNGKTKCTKWVYTFTETGEDAIAVVLEPEVL